MPKKDSRATRLIDNVGKRGKMFKLPLLTVTGRQFCNKQMQK